MDSERAALQENVIAGPNEASGNEINTGRSSNSTGFVVGTNPEDVKVFDREAASAPTAHKLLGRTEGVGSAEAFVGCIIKLLIVTMLLPTATLT